MMFDYFRKQRAAWQVPEGRRAYAVGDIHGRLDLLDNMLLRIQSDIAARPPADTYVVFLGDLIDRGPASREVVERLRTLGTSRFTPVFLAGNHEEVLLRLIAGEHDLFRSWLKFGGIECARSYGLDPERLRQLDDRSAVAELKAAVPPEHVDFLDSFHDSFRFGDYLFVHAGIRPGIDLGEQQQIDLRWIRAAFLDSDADHGFVVVHGHTITKRVDERANRIGIDTGAYSSGRLTAIGLEGEERWYLSATSANEKPAGSLVD